MNVFPDSEQRALSLVQLSHVPDPYMSPPTSGRGNNIFAVCFLLPFRTRCSLNIYVSFMDLFLSLDRTFFQICDDFPIQLMIVIR